jgi:hypothetical protein
VWKPVSGAGLQVDANGVITVRYGPTYWGGMTTSTAGRCNYTFGGQARLVSGGGYSFGVRATIDTEGVPHAQTIQYDAGIGGYRDVALPERSESGLVSRARLDYAWHTVTVTVAGNRYIEAVDGKTIFQGSTTLPCGGLFVRLWNGTTAQFHGLYVLPGAKQ